MVEVSIEDGTLHLELLGWSKLAALAGSLDIPLACVKSAAAGPPGLPKFQWGDRRVGGTGLPGLVAAGRFIMGTPRRHAFLDLRGSSKDVVVLELADYRYDLVMVEVADASRALQVIGAAIPRAAAAS
jgi:hypothetical protein